MYNENESFVSLFARSAYLWTCGQYKKLSQQFFFIIYEKWMFHNLDFSTGSSIKYLFKLFYIYIITNRTIPAYVADLCRNYRILSLSWFYLLVLETCSSWYFYCNIISNITGSKMFFVLIIVFIKIGDRTCSLDFRNKTCTLKFF